MKGRQIMKKTKLAAIVLASVMVMSCATACSGGSTGTGSSSSATGSEDASKYEVTKPTTVEWWHTTEKEDQQYLDNALKGFSEKYPNITVKPVYLGSYSDINEKLGAAQAAGTTLPGLSVVVTPIDGSYAQSGICEDLGPYVKATKYDTSDFGEGLIKASSYGGKLLSMPFLTSTQVMFYNKDIATAEGIKIPEKFDQMDEFLSKAAKISNGKTTRYGLIIPGWDTWYYEFLFMDNGVKVVNADQKTTDLTSSKALSIANKIKGWCTSGKASLGYGTGASANMRQKFISGQTFAVYHTSSLASLYKSQCKFNVGMAFVPGGSTGRNAESGGAVLIIPSKNSQDVKNAAWKLMTYLTDKKTNFEWSTGTGYFPTRKSVYKSEEGKQYLAKNPEFSIIFNNLDHIMPCNQNKNYPKLATLWGDSFAKSIIEGTDMNTTMKEAAKQINELLQDQ